MAARGPSRRSSPSPKPASASSAGASSAKPGWGSRLSFWLVALVVLIPPLVLWPDAKEAFRLPKLVATNVLVLISLVGLALAWRPAVGRLNVAAFWLRPEVLASVPLFLAGLVAGLVSSHPLYARDALLDGAVGLAAFLGWTLALRSAQLRRLLELGFAPALVLSVLALLQALDLWEPLRFAGGQERTRLGVTALAGNPGDLAAFLLLPILLAQDRLARLLDEGFHWRRALWPGLTLLLALAALAQTQTVTTLVALLVGLAIYWWRFLTRKRSLVWVAGGLAVLLVGALAVAPLRQRLSEKARDLARGDINHLLTGRLDGWRAAGWMFERHPLLGVGPGSYQAEFGDARLALVDQGVRFFRSQQTPVFANAHNEYLEVAADTGLLGLAALGFGLWLLFRALRGLSRKARERDAALAWAGAAVLAVLALTYFPFRVAITAYPALLFLGWIFRSFHESESQPSEPRP
ncbi:MAG TPA: O-antigen ligase family protein [Thermoanaerobaculia bacterium]|nr:O-antigen ligase family protein [Thermoanaerobaculia bacterium]